MKHKVLVIGLDGASWKTLGPLIERGKLPVIGSLVKGGASGILESTFNPMSPPAWASAVTGVNPGKHGIFEFFKQVRGSYAKEVIRPKDLRAPALWDILGERRKKVGIVNFPIIYPPPRVNGFFISGMLTPNEKCEYTYPKELKSELEGHVTEPPDIKLVGDNVRYVESVMESEEKVARSVLYLMENKEWDLFMVVFSGPDRLSHYLWSCFDGKHKHGSETRLRDALERYYVKMDGIIGRMTSLCGRDTYTLVMSDHGFQSVERRFNVNNWLASEGFMARAGGGEAYRSVYESLLRKSGALSVLYKVYFRLKKENLISGLPTQFTKFLPNTSPLLDYTRQVDWSRTKAYYFLEGMIRINLRGREAGGVVEESEYVDARDDVIRKLRSLRDPSDNSLVVAEAHKREDVYSGPFLNEVADIVFRVNERYMCSGFGTSVFDDAGSGVGSHTGYHAPEGIWIVNGPGVRRKKIDANITDITPTILTMMELPLPPYMDGRVPKGIFMKKTAGST